MKTLLLIGSVSLLFLSEVGLAGGPCGCDVTPHWFTPVRDGEYYDVIKRKCPSTCRVSNKKAKVKSKKSEGVSRQCEILTGGGKTFRISCDTDPDRTVPRMDADFHLPKSHIDLDPSVR